MLHLFLNHDLKQLLDLKTTLQGTLKNPVCDVLATNVTDTINQIDEELKQRGIYPLRQFYNPAFETKLFNQSTTPAVKVPFRGFRGSVI